MTAKLLYTPADKKIIKVLRACGYVVRSKRLPSGRIVRLFIAVDTSKAGAS